MLMLDVPWPAHIPKLLFVAAIESIIICVTVKIDMLFAPGQNGVPQGDVAAKCAAMPVTCNQTTETRALIYALMSLVLMWLVWYCLLVWLTARRLHLRSMHEVKLARILSALSARQIMPVAASITANVTLLLIVNQSSCW